MKLWVTPAGDKWLCDECQVDLEQQITDEKWRVAFEKEDAMLRCSACGLGDVEIFD
jgi:hypothetical protein